MCKNHKRGVVKCAGKEGRGKGGSLACAKRQTGDPQATAWLRWIDSGVVLVLGLNPGPYTS